MPRRTILDRSIGLGLGGALPRLIDDPMRRGVILGPELTLYDCVLGAKFGAQGIYTYVASVPRRYRLVQAQHTYGM